MGMRINDSWISYNKCNQKTTKIRLIAQGSWFPKVNRVKDSVRP